MRSKVLAGILLAGTLQGTAPSSAVDVRDLPARHREWLREVAVIITSAEEKAFLALAKDYQRDAYIGRFWKARDPYPETERNEFKLAWDERLAAARERYESLEEDRARFLLLRGEPGSVLRTDCGLLLWPLEIWTYTASIELPRGYALIFVQPGRMGRYQRWTPREGYQALKALAGGDAPVPSVQGQQRRRPSLPGERVPNELSGLAELLRARCTDSREVLRALDAVVNQDRFGELELAERRPSAKDSEWLATFAAVSTDLPRDAEPLAAELAFTFPGREAGRTVVAGEIRVPAGAAGMAELAGSRSQNFLLTGEVLQEGELFESFRYRFDIPLGSPPPGPAAAAAADEAVSMVFERLLRPGEYTFVVKLEDLSSGRTLRLERPLAVPLVEADRAVATEAQGPPAEGPLARASQALDDAYQALAGGGGPGLRLAAPPGDVHVGPVRIDATVTGDAVRRVTFLLDGQAVLTKSRPPFGVELNLGAVPRTRTIRAVAVDASGREVASDELILNAGAQPFTVRLVEPRPGRRGGGDLRVRADVHLPDGARLDRLEIFLDEARVATLYQSPFVQTVALPPGRALAYVRAVAYLAEGADGIGGTAGATAEDLVLLNAPDAAEEIDVQLVEVYAAVKAGGRPVADLRQEEVAVREDGVPQRILRFERVAEIPLHVVLVVDSSASMADVLPAVRAAGAEFLRGTLGPRDRAAVVTFSDSPILAAKFTNDVQLLAGSLAGLHAERGTALYDCIVFALQYMKGLRGQSALLVISDGGDRASRFSFDDTLELARRSGVTIYGLGMGLKRFDLEGRLRLSRLAEETGGRAFFPKADADLAPLWAGIGEELRSRWLVAYQSTGAGGPEAFRAVDLEVKRPGVEVQAMRGYYPQ